MIWPVEIILMMMEYMTASRVNIATLFLPTKMKIDKETLKKVAHLARVEVNPSMEKEMIKDLEEILTWVEKLNEVDTSGVAPLTHMSFEKNALREDIVKLELTKKEGLSNAPKHDGDYFQVPKVLDQKQ